MHKDNTYFYKNGIIRMIWYSKRDKNQTYCKNNAFNS